MKKTAMASMTGKALLIEAMKGRATPRPAWVPFVGVHGGALIGRTAADYLRSADLLVAGLRKARESYRPDGLPVVFDLQVEAEVLGCQLHWADDVPPAVVTHPLTMQTLDTLPPIDAAAGRFPVILEAMDRLTAEFGDSVALYGLVCGPFTLALHLLGNDIFLMMFDDPEKVKRIIAFCADVACRSADIYLDRGATVVGVVDPMTSQISPEHFVDYVTPNVNRVFDHIRGRGGLSSLFVCGDASRNLEAMCDTHADNISVDEQIPMARLRDLCLARGKSFGGNLKLTAVLLLGNEDDARREAIEVMEASGATGFILAPGCDLPYHTPERNLRAVADMVHDDYARKVARASTPAKERDSFDDIELPDYDNHKPVIVDVITLDSTSCAPCQYMMEAVTQAARDAFVKTFVNEHKIKVRNGLGMMAKLGVQNLPTICIDGEVRFASIIPDHDTLVRAIEDAAIVKNRFSR